MSCISNVVANSTQKNCTTRTSNATAHQKREIGDKMKKFSSICVYCGSRYGAQPSYKILARRLGREIAKRGKRLVYGGGHAGLMGVIADAALDSGGEVVGIIPKFLESCEVAHRGLSELHIVENMHERKKMMFDMSDCIVVLPGGIGTLDETFEILTWSQLQIHCKPVIIIDSKGFWRPLHNMLEAIVEAGFADQEIFDLFSFVSTIDDVFAVLTNTNNLVCPEN